MPWILNYADINEQYSYAGGAYYIRGGAQYDAYWYDYMYDIDEKIEKWLNYEFKKYGLTRR